MSTQTPTPEPRAGAPDPRPAGRWRAEDGPRPTERAPYTFDPDRTKRLRTHVSD